MGLLLAIFLLLFVLPIASGIVLLINSKRELGILILSIPLLIILCIVGWWTYETNHHFVKSTSLENEKLDQISLNQPFTSEFIEKYGDYKNIDNVFYDKIREFQQLMIGTNEEKEIIFISTDNPQIKTTNNVTVGDPIEEVIRQYGKNYYKYRDMGMDDSINYIDRKSKIHIQIYFRDEQVTEIVLQEM